MTVQKMRAATAMMLVLCCTGTFAHAAPVQFDTEDAHVIVTRPIDAFSGNKVTDEYTLENVEKKKVSFSYVDSSGNKILGFKSEAIFPWNKKLAEDGVVQAVAAELSRLGFTLDGHIIYIEQPTTVQSSEMPAINIAQDGLFNEAVVRQGNPATLPDRIRSKQLAHTVLAVAMMGIGMEKFGAVNGSQLVYSSGLINDVARLTIYGKQALVAVPAVPFDYSPYQSVDLRKLVDGRKDRVGQIIIAYKGEKTAQAEQKALAKAIVIASGADTTVEAITASRQADRAARQAIWDACVAHGSCQSE